MLKYIYSWSWPFYLEASLRKQKMRMSPLVSVVGNCCRYGEPSPLPVAWTGITVAIAMDVERRCCCPQCQPCAPLAPSPCAVRRQRGRWDRRRRLCRSHLTNRLQIPPVSPADLVDLHHHSFHMWEAASPLSPASAGGGGELDGGVEREN